MQGVEFGHVVLDAHLMVPLDVDGKEGQAVAVYAQLRHVMRHRLCRVLQCQVLAPHAAPGVPQWHHGKVEEFVVLQ